MRRIPARRVGHEDRDYHIQVDVEPAAVGREKLAARVTVVAGDDRSAKVS